MFFLFVVVVSGITFAAMIVVKNIQDFDAKVGKDQFKMIETYLEAEKIIFYIQKNAEFSLWDSVEEFSNKGGFITTPSECGAEIWDQADICPKCGFALSRGTLSRPPVEDWWRRRWMTLVGILTAAAFLLWLLGRYI